MRIFRNMEADSRWRRYVSSLSDYATQPANPVGNCVGNSKKSNKPISRIHAGFRPLFDRAYLLGFTPSQYVKNISTNQTVILFLAGMANHKPLLAAGFP